MFVVPLAIFYICVFQLIWYNLSIPFSLKLKKSAQIIILKLITMIAAQLQWIYSRARRIYYHPINDDIWDFLGEILIWRNFKAQHEVKRQVQCVSCFFRSIFKKSNDITNNRRCGANPPTSVQDLLLTSSVSSSDQPILPSIVWWCLNGHIIWYSASFSIHFFWYF